MIVTKIELLNIIIENLSLREAEKERVGVGAGSGGGGSSGDSTSASSSEESSSASSPATGEVGTVKGSKKISSLAPDAQPKFNEFIQKANAAGYTIIITSARRVPSHQWNLRYKGGGITPAKPCRSDHQYGYALDINASYTDSNGKKKSIRSKSSDAAWKPIVDIAKSVGLRWQGAKDRVHFYMKSVPGAVKDQCKQYYEEEGGKPLAKLGSKFMKGLEQNPQKNTSIKKILNLPNIEMFAENYEQKIKVTREELELIINESLRLSEAEKERVGVGAGAGGTIRSAISAMFGKKDKEASAGATGIGVESTKTMGSLDPAFRTKVEAVFSDLKAQGFDPGLGSAWRSPEDQIKKFKTGKSKVKIGTHSNIEPSTKKPAAWAADIVQKGVGWASTVQAFDFFVALGNAAHKHGLVWGGDWSPKKKKIEGKEYTIGWDPAHVEWEPASSAQVKANLKKAGIDVDALAMAESIDYYNLK